MLKFQWTSTLPLQWLSPVSRLLACAMLQEAVFTHQATVARKKLVIKNFLEGLKLAAPKYNAFLKRPSNVPEWFTYEPDEAVFVLLSPFELNKKKKIKILNEMLIDWVNGMVKSPSKKEKKEMKASSKWHSPSTLSTTIRSFLAATKEFFGWDFMVSDFKFDGGFNAFFKQLVDDRRKIDVSNGR